MLLQLIRTSISGLTYILMPDASDFQLGACIIQEGSRLPTSCKSWWSHSKTTQQWKKKCFSSLQLSKNFKVCYLVRTFFFWITKTWCLILSKRSMYYAGIQKLKRFTHTTLHQGLLQYSSQQPFKAPLPIYTGSDCGGEETCRACRGF